MLKGACKKQISVQLQVTLANCSSDEEMVVEPTQTKITDDNMSTIVAKLKESNQNWFHLYEQFENEGKMLAEELSDYMNKAYQKLSLVLPENEMKQGKTSKEAFDVDQSSSRDKHRAFDELNGMIVTESDSATPLSPNNDETVMKRVAAIKRSVRRRRAKYIASQDFVGRQKLKPPNTIVHSYPDIGSTIEKFVESCIVDADAWRRTGLITFDANVKIQKNCTYKRIQDHLESVYKCKFSYGTVVQLCVARNHRRLLSSRYKGVAQVTSHRARKGFVLKFNPDTHWSNALYRSLNILQLMDGRNMMFLNCDDAAGFRLDTHHSSPVFHSSGQEKKLSQPVQIM